jgi:hypothetical protein
MTTHAIDGTSHPQAAQDVDPEEHNPVVFFGEAGVLSRIERLSCHRRISALCDNEATTNG